MEEVDLNAPAEQEEIFVSKLWSPEPHANFFHAVSLDGTYQGKTYYKSEKLSIRRLRAYEKWTVGGLLDFKKLWEGINESIKSLNASQPVDAGIILDKIKTSLVDLNQGENQAMEICTLYWNFPGEDDRYFEYPQCQAKIKDWVDAGIEADFFLKDAILSIPGFIPAFKERFHSTLQEIIK